MNGVIALANNFEIKENIKDKIFSHLTTSEFHICEYRAFKQSLAILSLSMPYLFSFLLFVVLSSVLFTIMQQEMMHIRKCNIVKRPPWLIVFYL